MVPRFRDRARARARNHRPRPARGVIDPIAGGFRNYAEQGDYERFAADREWHADMVHPGFSDSRLEEMLDGGQMAARWREEEVRVLADDGLRSLLEDLDVELISYRELAASRN